MNPDAPLTTGDVVDIARRLGDAASLADGATWVVKYAVELTGARWAEVVETSQGRFRVLAATDLELSRALYRTREIDGDIPPLPDAGVPATEIVITDLARDERWSALVAAADTLPVRSAVLQYLVIDDRYSAGLAVYDPQPNYFSAVHLGNVRLLAGITAPILAGLAAAETNRQLSVALDSSRNIGAAVGIVMYDRRVDQQTAFDLLVDASQHRNQKLRDIADEVLATGTLT